RRIARREKARQRYGCHYWVADRDRRDPGADLARREGDRHQPQPALKIGDSEMDPRRAVRVEPDDVGKQRDDLAALVWQPGYRALDKAVDRKSTRLNSSH